MRVDDDVTRGAPATVFVSDPSVEAERIAQALRASGYLVVDVPLSMLVARVAVQRPRVILVDADADGALDAVSRVRELPDAEAIDILFLGRLGGAFAKAEDALAHEGSGFFSRPVDVDGLVQKVESLAGVARPSAEPHKSTPPPSIASSAPTGSRPPASLPPASMRVMEPSSSRPPAGLRAAQPSGPRLSNRPLGIEAGGALSVDPAKRAVATPLSNELEQLLAEAEQRVPVQVSPESVPPTPEEEIEAVLPAELLEALDEPLAEDDDDDAAHDASAPASRGAPAAKPTTGVLGTNAGTGAGTTGAGRRVTGAPKPLTGEAALTPVPPKTHGGTHGGSTSNSGLTGDAEVGAAGDAHAFLPPALGAPGPSQPPPTAYSPPRDAFPRGPERGEVRGPTSTMAMAPRAMDEPRAPTVLPASVLGPADAPRLVARAIATRSTGSLAFDDAGVARRLVLREGDTVTVASASQDESLLAFLGVRGDLPRETVRRLSGKFPGFGRHAGAALVAHGYLSQDQLWPTLRAHAEWILGRILQLASGTCVHEPEAPGRLRNEPGVFGGSTGAEVFVEVLRRVVSQEDAIDRLGGAASRVADGPNVSLLGECALNVREMELVAHARGGSIQQALDAAPDADIATVLYAMSLLGVVDVLRAVGPASIGGDPEAERADVDALDEEAVRARVKARLQLVDEGDYFAVLGVPRNATSYEVRRAFVELRRAFDPSRILTPSCADLDPDVRKIVVVLEEAYEILRDAARRERYRRAIDAQPG